MEGKSKEFLYVQALYGMHMGQYFESSKLLKQNNNFMYSYIDLKKLICFLQVVCVADWLLWNKKINGSWKDLEMHNLFLYLWKFILIY